MNGSYQFLAGKYVRRQTRQLVGQFDGVRKADDPEFVHRARVASRRLRAALGIFRGCFEKKKLKRWRKEVRRLTQALGAARDKDVQIEFVRGVLANLQSAAQRPGIARLVLRLEQNRRALQPQAVEAIDRLEASGAADEMLSASKKMLSKLNRGEVSPVSRFSARRARKQITKCLNRFLDYEDCLANPQDVRQHHEMRIAAKRLRYTLEICGPVYEGGLGEFILATKQVQSLLGDIHDCDVWVEDIEEFVKNERKRTVAYFGNSRPFGRLKVGLDHLREERDRHRQEGFAELVRFWQELDREKAWERLVKRLNTPPEAPLEPREGSAPQSLATAASSGSKPAGGAPASRNGGNRQGRRRRIERGSQPPAANGDGDSIPGADRAVEQPEPDGPTGNRQRALSDAAGPGEGGS